MIAEFAPAKINLALHVTGRRPDGYHLLDSLVVFAEIGDRVLVAPDVALSLKITGPQAGSLTHNADNLVLRAAQSLAQTQGAAIMLEKNLPVASGIGGGSADAAASLRALARLWKCPLPPPESILRLGADVPVCLAQHACRMQGVGETITPLGAALPPCWVVLVNPALALPTPDVFKNLANHANAAMPDRLPHFADAHALAGFLHHCRNDLEPAARALCPAIPEIIAGLQSQSACLLARMSGSGATCFGLFSTESAAQTAAQNLKHARPDWWLATGAIRQS